jgi:sirohydrochlorin ferrochelatase
VTGGDRCVVRGATRVLVVPYLLSAGVHLLRDLTAARDQLEGCHPGVEFRLGPALGPHPLLDQLVVERARQLDTLEAPSLDAAAAYAPIDRPGGPRTAGSTLNPH